MEQDRTLRTLIPPFVVFTSLLWVTTLQTGGWPTFPSDRTVTAIFVAVLAGGAAVVAVGFVLSSVSIWLLRRWSRRWYKVTIDIAGFSNDVIKGFCSGADLPLAMAKKYPLQCAAAYDHKTLRVDAEGLHEWAARRWNVFHVSAHCCLALVFAHGLWIVYHLAQAPNLLGWSWSWRLVLGWWLPDVLLFGCLAHNAYDAFCENRDLFRMLVEAKATPHEDPAAQIHAAEQADEPDERAMEH